MLDNILDSQANIDLINYLFEGTKKAVLFLFQMADQPGLETGRHNQMLPKHTKTSRIFVSDGRTLEFHGTCVVVHRISTSKTINVNNISEVPNGLNINLFSVLTR